MAEITEMVHTLRILAPAEFIFFLQTFQSKVLNYTVLDSILYLLFFFCLIEVSDSEAWYSLKNFFSTRLFIWESQSEKESRIQRDLKQKSSIHSPYGCNGQHWARPKPGTRNFIQVSHVVQGPKHLSYLSLRSQEVTRKLDWKWSVRNKGRHRMSYWHHW